MLIFIILYDFSQLAIFLFSDKIRQFVQLQGINSGCVSRLPHCYFIDRYTSFALIPGNSPQAWNDFFLLGRADITR